MDTCCRRTSPKKLTASQDVVPTFTITVEFFPDRPPRTRSPAHDNNFSHE